jgi:hypothetical protein
MWLTEIGPLYDWPNESVILLVENAAPSDFRDQTKRNSKCARMPKKEPKGSCRRIRPARS